MVSASPKASSSANPRPSSAPPSASTMATASSNTRLKPSRSVACTPSSLFSSSVKPGLVGTWEGLKHSRSRGSMSTSAIQLLLDAVQLLVLVRQVRLELREPVLHVEHPAEDREEHQSPLRPRTKRALALRGHLALVRRLGEQRGDRQHRGRCARHYHRAHRERHVLSARDGLRPRHRSAGDKRRRYEREDLLPVHPVPPFHYWAASSRSSQRRNGIHRFLLVSLRAPARAGTRRPPWTPPLPRSPAP